MPQNQKLESEVALMTLSELQSSHLRLYGKPAINASRKAIRDAVLRGLIKTGGSVSAAQRGDGIHTGQGGAGGNGNSTVITLTPTSPSRSRLQEFQRASLSFSEAHISYLGTHSADAVDEANRKQRRLQASGVTPHYAQPSSSSAASVASRMLLWASKTLRHYHATRMPSDPLEKTFMMLSLSPNVVRRRELFLADPLKWDPAVAYAESALKAAAALKYSLKPHLCTSYIDYNSCTTSTTPKRKNNRGEMGGTDNSEDSPLKCERTLALRRYAAVERQQSMWNLAKFVEQGPSYLVSVWRGKFDPVALQREYNGQYIIPSLDYLREEVLDVERKRRKLTGVAKKLAKQEGGDVSEDGTGGDDDEADPLSDVPTPGGYDEPEPSDSRFAPTLDIQLNPSTNTLTVKLHLSEAQIRALAANSDKSGDSGDVAVSGATFLFRSEFVCLTTDVWIGIRGPWKGQIMQFLRKTTAAAQGVAVQSGSGSSSDAIMLTTPPIGPALSLPLTTSRKLNRQKLLSSTGDEVGDADDDDEEAIASASANACRGTRSYLGLLSSHVDVPPVDCVIVGTAADDHSYCFEKLASARSGNLDDPFKCTECGNLRRANNIVYTGKDGSTLCRGRYFCIFCQANTVHLHISGGPSDAVRRPWRGAVGQRNPLSSGVLEEAPFRGVSVPKPTNRTWVGNPLI